MHRHSRGRGSVPVVDIFAGPGGLNEGFSSFIASDGARPFSTRLSIERDPTAHLTLTLRAFFRQFPPGRVHADYYDFLRNIDTPLGDRLDWLFGHHPAEAVRAFQEAKCAELGADDPEVIREWIDAGLNGAENWVLLGGPPCQAYSLAGRSRNKGVKDYDPLKDKKQFLYREYLRILADHLPAVFIMENVQGLLSATIEEELIFNRICEDLHDPVQAVRREGRNVRWGRGAGRRYKLFSLVDYKGKGQSYTLFETAADNAGRSLNSFIVRMERHGVPQARHRLIILGVREDLGSVQPKTLETRARRSRESPVRPAASAQRPLARG
ncbi:MAG: DNA cytosine methyltransferase [Pyrinomonadaceae bacterium]